MRQYHFKFWVKIQITGPKYTCTVEITSSSAMTERPCDASCLSVVSYSVIPRAQYFIIFISASDIRLRTIKCCSVVFGITLTGFLS